MGAFFWKWVGLNPPKPTRDPATGSENIKKTFFRDPQGKREPRKTTHRIPVTLNYQYLDRVGLTPLEQWSTSSGKSPKWCWGSVLENLQLNNSLTNIVILDILHFPGKKITTPPPPAKLNPPWKISSIFTMHLDYCFDMDRRLVKWFISHRLHTGACVNLVLLTYLLIH